MDAQALTTTDRIEQLEDRTAGSASELERLSAAVTAMDARLAAMERGVAAMREAQESVAGRLEHVAASLDHSGRIDALEERFGAARAATENTADRLERLASEVTRQAGLENSMVHLRSELAEQLAEHAEEARVAAKSGGIELSRQVESTRRLQEEQQARLEHLTPLVDRMTNAERRVTEVGREIGGLAVRIDEVADERAGLREIAQRSEQHAASRITELTGITDDLRTEVAAWTKRIEGQSEAVREAQAIAARLQETAERMRAEHSQTAEAQRIAEARVEKSLEQIRQEQVDAWEIFTAQRAKERTEADRVRQSREEQDREALAEDLEQREARVRGTIAELEGRLEQDVLALDVFRRAMAEILVRARDDNEEAVRSMEALLPGSAQPALVSERRQALRRAMRARREGNEGH